MLHIAENGFDAAFFGGPVWRYDYDRATNPADVAASAAAGGVRLVACRIPDDDETAALALQAAGFRPVERLVTLHRPVDPVPPVEQTVVETTDADRDACIEIAIAALRQDRYHADPQIDDRIADAVKAAWVSNNIAGRASANLVARNSHGRTVGFNQIVQHGREAVIDLIAVAPSGQRQGHGRALVAAGLRSVRGRADTMRVGTQATNLASLALYRSLGFAVLRTQRTYHLTPASGSRP
jgi:ribosomal protein S18 acetylase RimI-like enzyme